MGRFTRRQFVSSLGMGVIAVPFVQSLFQARAVAKQSQIPVRFLGVRTYHGTDRNLFIPRQLNGAAPASADVSLSELTFEYENAFLSPLQPWRNRVTVLDGLDQWVCFELSPQHHGHEEQATGLTGAGTGAGGEISAGHPSLDFYLHGRLSAPALLSAGAGSDSTWKELSYDDNGNFRQSTYNPADLFREAFPADFQPPDPGEFVDYSDAERRVFEHSISSLDRLKAELTGPEREKLEKHADAMDRLIDNLTSTPPAACDTSGMDVPESLEGNSLEDLERLTALHAQVIAQAFACGRARCATLRIGSDYVCPQSELPGIQALDLAGAFGSAYASEWRFHENLVHDYWANFEHPSFDMMQRAYALGQVWQTERFVAVLEALDGLLDPLDPSGQSTVLDNTIVYWHNEFGHGPHDNQAEFIPAVVAGGAAGCLRMGRYLRLRQPDGGSHVPHNRLLTSFAMAMGFPDVEFFGDQALAADPGSYGIYHGELTEIMG
jgi:hypothetical protein